jgi:redox-sensing transcriptional repressor
MKKNLNIPKKLLKRLSHYHYYLGQLEKRNRDYVSSEHLAADLGLGVDQVREDLENLHESLSVSDIHSVKNLLGIVETYLGYDQVNTAVIAGAGNLGRALLNYPGFRMYGLDILAIFDNDEHVLGTKVGEKEIFPVDRLEELTDRLKVHMGIITTPPEPAQQIADMMIESGIRGIWNFTQARIRVPMNVELRNTSLYADYLCLSQKMERKYERNMTNKQEL